MAHYWLPDATSSTGTGNWSATGATGHWADDAGGTNLGKAAPGATDNVFFGAAAFNGAGQTVTVDATANCLDLSFVGATNNPTLAGTGQIQASGNITFIANMVYTHSSYLIFNPGGSILTTNGLDLSTTNGILPWTGASLTLGDNLNIGAATFYVYEATVNTNGKTVTCGSFTDVANADAKTITLGASIINCTSWVFANAGMTLTANTSTINDSGNFNGNGKTTYNIVNATGATCTITGNNTMNTLGFTRAGVQTITATGTTQTVSYMRRDNGIAVKTWVNGSYVNRGGARIVMPYSSLSGATFTPANLWYFPASTDGGSNSGATFKYPPNGGGWWALRH